MLVAICTLRLAAEDAPQTAYIDCSTGNKHRIVPVYSNPCVVQPVWSLSCGARVEVLGREGPWLRIAAPNGTGERYISVSGVSQQPDRFAALNLPAPTDPYIQDCTAFRPKTGKLMAIPIYASDPEYTPEARSKRIQGTITLAVTVGPDGRAHDIKVLTPLGHGLDEKAVETVQSWRWEPALDNGKPVASNIDVEVTFRTPKEK